MRNPPPAPFDKWMPLEMALVESWAAADGSRPSTSRLTGRSPKNTARQYEHHAQQLREALEKAREEAHSEFLAKHVAAAKSTPGSPLRLRESPPKRTAARFAQGVESYVTRSKLKLRSGSILDSRHTGELPIDSIVSVLEQIELDDGTKRVRVAKFGESTPLGWVSCDAKDGRSNLVPFHWTRFQRVIRRATSLTSLQDSHDSDTNAPSQSSTTSPSASPNKLRRGSRESRASVESMEASDQHAKSAEPEAEWKQGKSPTRTPSSSRVRSSNAGKQLDTALNAVSFSAKMKGRSSSDEAANQAAEALNKKKNSMVERFKPQSAQEIREMIAILNAEMSATEESLKEKNSTLQSQLGATLYKSNVKVGELVKKWTTSSKGVAGGASKVDFRKHVRSVIDWGNVKDIDAFFGELDADGDGSLTPAELTGVINRLIDQARVAAVTAGKIEVRISFFKDRIRTATDVANVTADAENADTRLEMIANNKSPDVRLGAELLRRNTKVGDLLKTWEATDGEVNKKQFRKNVRTLGINDEDDALDALFDTMDQDGGGTLDLEELKSALTSLREASVESDREVERLKKRSADQWKAAKIAQLELKKLRKADEVAEAARLEAEAAALEERKAEAEAKAAQLEAKKAAAAKAREEEKAAYDAKIAMRRAAAGSSSGLKVAAGKAGKI